MIQNLHKQSLALLLLFFLLLGGTVHAQVNYVPEIKELRLKNKGVVVSAHALASEAGASVMRKGGNAFDAAIATQFALAVVYPQAGNIGGGGFMTAHTAAGKNFTLDYRETAPAAASKNMFVDASGKARTDWSQDGHLAVGIPGSVKGMEETLRFAKLSWKQLLQPAIALAENGFSLTEEEAKLLNEHRADFLKFNKNPYPFVQEKEWQGGDLLVQKDLAKTLRRIAERGASEFYTGETARYIASEMLRGNGLLKMADLAAYKALFRKPLELSFQGNTVITMGLPSSGGIILGQIFKMLENTALKNFEQNSPEAVQLITEAERRAYADRAEYMGDPAFTPDKTDYLLSDAYLNERWKSYTPSKPTPSAYFKTDKNTAKESDQTTHISIYDAEGNAVSITNTLNGYYGSRVIVEGAGFLLNNEMDDFSIKPGVPNMFGAVGGEANAVAPGKRMLSSMTPTIVLKKGKPKIIVGSPGGTTIPTSVLQALLNLEIFGKTPNEAVNLPKFHHQWLPDLIYHEQNFPKRTREALEKMGYVLKERNPIGRTELIYIAEDGTTVAIADGRGNDAAAAE